MTIMQVLVVMIAAIVVGIVADMKTYRSDLLMVMPYMEIFIYVGMIVFLFVMCLCFTVGKIRVVKTSKKIVSMVI